MVDETSCMRQLKGREAAKRIRMSSKPQKPEAYDSWRTWMILFQLQIGQQSKCTHKSESLKRLVSFLSDSICLY